MSHYLCIPSKGYSQKIDNTETVIVISEDETDLDLSCAHTIQNLPDLLRLKKLRFIRFSTEFNQPIDFLSTLDNLEGIELSTDYTCNIKPSL
jgi:hypothetical protein